MLQYQPIHMQNVIELLFKNDVALLTSSLSSSTAVVRNDSILNLPKFVSICWCKYYLRLKSTKIPLVSCIRAPIKKSLSTHNDLLYNKKSPCY